MTSRLGHYFTELFPLNRPLKILLATNSLVSIALAMIVPIWAIFVERIGGNIIETGLATGLLAVTAGIVVLVSGKFSDGFKQSELIVSVGYALLGGVFIFYIFVSEIWMLVIAQIMAGIAVAIWDPAFDAVYSKHLKKDAVARQWGVWEAMNYFSQAGGATMGAIIAASFGFDALFGVMAAMCLGSAIYILRLPRQVL